jgi:threonine/homoserine/homoserine lactone efflux protein
MSSFAIGFASALPMMLAFGPIGVLLVETGLGHGFRRGWVAGVGVAAADLTFASLAVLGGAALARVLEHWDVALHVAAIVVLTLIGVNLLVRALRARRSSNDETPRGTIDAGSVATTTRVRRRLVPRFYAMTLANPLTIVAFASLVLAGGAAAQGRAWAFGVAAASLIVHVSLVAIGSGLGGAFAGGVQRWLRAAGGMFVIALAVLMAVGR